MRPHFARIFSERARRGLLLFGCFNHQKAERFIVDAFTPHFCWRARMRRSKSKWRKGHSPFAASGDNLEAE